MAFEDFLRTIPLVHKHIMRTRRLIHENMLLRKFLERNGLDVEDVLSTKTTVWPVAETRVNDAEALTESVETVQTLVESLRAEQIRSASLEADLYVLQIDYDDLLAYQEMKQGNYKSTSIPD